LAVIAGQTVEVHDFAQLGVARHELERYLHGHSLPAELTYDLLTCIQEASKNALRFAATPCGVLVSVTVDAREILVTVRDHGSGLDLERLTDLKPDPLSESGRGLFLLHALMDEVEFHLEDGTEVRLRKRLGPEFASRTEAA
jgi:serine/threonine-protein kinase RsbW